MEFSLTHIWSTMGLPARVVACVLLAMGLASLTVFMERLRALRRSRTQSRRFAIEVADDLESGLVDRILEAAAKHPHAQLARLVASGLETFRRGALHREERGLTPVERARRQLQRRLEEIGAELRRGMPVLSSVGSVAPFVGLLGTVLGIISAFQGIAATGSGGLSSVSAGISEALIETAFGLAVAIPAVLCFNYLTTAIARDELALTNAAGELVDMLEGWEEPEVVQTGARRERVA